ncbi:hypothetical protein GCM10025861_13680 [Methanobacterium petrolearium]|nr:hypothetical protein GCM10025861_13680 [Methanobacterium petrolearium]
MNCVMMATESCNISCKYCYMDANGKNHDIEPIGPLLDIIEHLECIKIDKLIIGVENLF